MLWSKNMVIKLENRLRFRILWSDPQNDAVWVINIDDKKALPELFLASYLLDSLTNSLLQVLESSQVNALPHDMKLTEAEERHCNKAWDSISSIVDCEPGIYISRVRAGLVKQAEKSSGLSRPTIYGNLRRFWQGGLVKATLIPAFSNCGARGIAKPCTDKKRGRPREITPGKGTNVDAQMQSNMFVAIRRYYLKSNPSVSLKRAYNWFICNCFPDAVKVGPSDGGTKVTIIAPDAIPTFEQFKYYFNKETSISEKFTKRLGKREFEIKHRLLLSDSNSEVLGPGDRYQIDATIVDLYLISRFDRNRIIGKATLYLVIDVFSRMIVGFYLGLEPPSWMGAAMALINTAEDKVSFCARYGISISSDEWPVKELCSVILGDRGEMESHIANTLATNFNMAIENTPPYRGDAKGIVERNFRTIQAVFGDYCPGYVEKNAEIRSGQNYVYDAKLTIDELHIIIINTILEKNNSVRRNYHGSPELVADNVAYAPVELWRWGREKYISQARSFDIDYVKHHLLPTATVSITRSGIKFSEGLYFHNTELLTTDWYIRAQERKLKIEASYHPCDITSIFIPSPFDTRSVIKCDLVGHSLRFTGKSLSEVKALRRRERQNGVEYTYENQARNVGYLCSVEDVVSSAKRQAKEEHDPFLSKRQRYSEIGSNRAQEQKELTSRQVSGFGIGLEDQKAKAPTRIKNNPDAEYENRLLASKQRRTQ